jgi:iron-sulfur cluster repair protein YtfE (RIC family)
MTILDVVSQYRGTEAVFRRYDAAAGVCLCCQALFDSLEEAARKYGLDLETLLADLEEAVGVPLAVGKNLALPEE